MPHQRKSCGTPNGGSKACAATLTAGQERVSRLLRPPFQAKLRGESTSDVLEREADRLADRAVSSSAAPCARCAAGLPCDGAAAHGTSGSSASLGGGAPLPNSERGFFEARFGHNFAAVRVHTGSEAHGAARMINARAFARGSDVVLADGEYRPGTIEGRRLLAHELVHVIQNGAAPALLGPRSSTPQNVTAAPPGLVLRTPDPRLEQYLEALDALRTELQAPYRTEFIVERVWQTVSEVDLTDPDNLVPISRRISDIFPEAVVGFFERVQRVTRQRSAMENYGRIRPNHPLGYGGVGLFPYTGAALSPIAQQILPVTEAAAAAARAGSAFVDGVITGVREGVPVAAADAFARRLTAVSLLNVVLPLPFVSGTAVGIGRDIWETITGVIELIGNFSEVVGQMVDLVKAVLDEPEAARVMGQDLGASYARRIVEMSTENIVVFAYHLGEIVGPTIVYTILSALGLPEIAGAVILRRLAGVLRRFPRIARILEGLATRLRPHRTSRPDVAEGGDRAGARGPERADGDVEGSRPTRVLSPALATVCRLGSLNCDVIPERILNQVGSYPHPNRVPMPSGPFRIRGLSDPEYVRLAAQRTTAFMQRVYLRNPDHWTPEFRAAYEAAGNRWPRVDGRDWQVHHRRPLDFGGDNSIENFVALEPTIHYPFTTWWRSVKDRIHTYFSDADWRAIIGGDRDQPLSLPDEPGETP